MRPAEASSLTWPLALPWVPHPDSRSALCIHRASVGLCRQEQLTSQAGAPAESHTQKDFVNKTLTTETYSARTGLNS